MKRVTLVLVGLLLCAAALIAQARPPRTQTGNATQEMQTPGLSAGHNSLPIGSKAKIRSLSNGREIEVTITEQIPTSTRRIIDLSPTAALSLELGFGGPVIVTPLLSPVASEPLAPAPLPPPPPPPPVAAAPEPFYMPEPEPFIPEPELFFEPEPELALAPPPPPPPPPPVYIPEPEPVYAPEPEPAKPSSPYTINYNYYIMSPEDFQRLLKSGALPQGGTVLTGSGGITPAAEPEPYTGTGAPPVSYSLFTAPPVSNIRIIPALPSPQSGKLYRLLVGTYPGVDSAFQVYRQLKAAGFEAVQEQAGNTCRVFAVGIPAPSVYYAAQRLGAIGFEQVWVHE